MTIFLPHLYSGQHWFDLLMALHPDRYSHEIIVQANPGGRQIQCSQGEDVGIDSPSPYVIESIEQTEIKTFHDAISRYFKVYFSKKLLIERNVIKIDWTIFHSSALNMNLVLAVVNLLVGEKLTPLFIAVCVILGGNKNIVTYSNLSVDGN